MPVQASGRRWGSFAIASTIALSLTTVMVSQNLPHQSNAEKSANPQAQQSTPRVFEDDEVKIPIPEGWAVWPIDPFDQLAEKGTLILQKEGYTLALGYDAGHASGIIGGRFLEMLTIPWLDDTDQESLCSCYLGTSPQPVSRRLMFISLIIRSGDSKVRENCGISKNLGHWTEKEGEKSFVGEQRWFAGYFTTAGGPWFFSSAGTGCADKAYTLTSNAKAPEQLPSPDDPALRKIISEAIDVVGSIQYKRCPPAATP